MAINQTSPSGAGIWKAITGALDIFSNINKARGVSEDPNPLPEDEFSSTLSDKKIIELKRGWTDTYSKYFNEIEPSQSLAFEYWIGRHKADDEGFQGYSLVINKIFKAVETFIPIATRANPDPLVSSDPSPVGEQFAHSVKSALVSEADRQKMRKILKKLIRHWIIYRIGIIKVGYDPIKEQITTEVINPKRWMGDVDGHWDEAGHFTGEWMCEKKKNTAARLKEMFPKKADDIDMKSKGKDGTKIEYLEWWYRGRDVFYTMEDIVLGKFKNPHWNWDVSGKSAVKDDDGNTVLEEVPEQKGINHLDEPKDPYIGLSIFSTGLQPHDETGLIIQNIPLQDEVNERARQISRNVKGMNNGLVVSADFTESQAAGAAAALRKGQSIRTPGKDVSKAVMRLPAAPIPAQVFQQQQNAEQELEDIFGISGSSPSGIDQEDTVRGKIMVNQMDSSRIGGGITEYLEQVADSVYNYWAQLMCVHFTEEHAFITEGVQEGTTMISIINTQFALVKGLNITVKEGSLIPKDPMTQRNEAIDLWSVNAIDPRNFYKRLDFADPDGMTQSLILWQMLQKGAIQPQMYLPTFQISQPPQQGQPQVPVGAPQGGQPPVTPSNQTPAPQSPPAVQAQEHALIESVPV